MAKSEGKNIYRLLTWLGALATVILLAIGGLAWYGSDFTMTSVRDELSAQKIYFPPKGSPALDPTEFPDLQQYAGQLVDDGPKAKAYANGYIGRHLEKVADGKTYAEVSTLAREDPTNQTLQGQKQSLLSGAMLRGSLLGNGYAFWTIGQILQYVAIATFIGAGFMALLVLLGLTKLARIR